MSHSGKIHIIDCCSWSSNLGRSPACHNRGWLCTQASLHSCCCRDLSDVMSIVVNIWKFNKWKFRLRAVQSSILGQSLLSLCFPLIIMLNESLILLHFPHVLVGRRLKILDYGKNICATLEKYLSQSPCSCRAASASPPPRRARRGGGTTPWSAAGPRPHGGYGNAGATTVWNKYFLCLKN